MSDCSPEFAVAAPLYWPSPSDRPAPAPALRNRACRPLPHQAAHPVSRALWALLAFIALFLAGCGSDSSVDPKAAAGGDRAQVREAADPPAPGPGYGFVYRFAKISNGAYFYTGNDGERDIVLADFPDFRYEGVAFLKTTTEPSVPVYRFANLGNGGYFYTANTEERDFVIQNRPDMRFEGTTFSVSLPSNPNAVPIYRLANLGNGAYLYTSSEPERDFAVGTGIWRAEGTAFSVLSSSVVLPSVVSGFTGDLASSAGTGDGGGGDGGSGSGGGDGGSGAGGAGSEGAIRFADVRLYDSTGKLLGSAVSDAKGLVTLRANGSVGPFLVEYLGNAQAQYFDEGLSTLRNAEVWVPFPAGEKISAYVLDLKRGMVASALTNAAAEDIRRSGVLPVTAAMVTAANEKMRVIFNGLFAGSGVAVTDITRMPSLVFSLESMRQLSNDSAGQYAQVLNSLARSAAQFNPTLANPAREMTKQLARDLSDGIINGRDSSGAAVAPPGQSAYEPSQLSQSVSKQTASALVVTTSGNGTVNSVANAQPVSCPSGAGLCYPFGTTVTLTPQAGTGAVFQGFSGACTGTAPCQLTLSGDRTISAAFGTSAPAGFTLTVSGSTGGQVSSSPAGIDCGSDCAEQFAPATSVSLTATPASGFTFTGWSGACSGLGTCITTMNADKSLTANFAVASFTLTVTKLGAGSGTVTSAPAGISCGTTCAASYVVGSSITLTATPAQGSTFAGWTGPCTGTGTCVVSIDQAKGVTANFALASNTLTVSTSGTGSGSISSSPSGIACGSDCTELYAFGTTVFLSATPGPGSSFLGWSGACGGLGTCVVTMSSSQSVTASFGVQGAWTWVGGSNLDNQSGTYGVKGTASANNTPGSRSQSAYWTDSAGNLWLHGGFGWSASQTSGDNWGYLSDLWKYNRSTGAWTWVSGSNSNFEIGLYGTKGVASPSNVPGGRYDASSWIDTAGNLWMFGGYGYDGQETSGSLNDLWKFNPSTNAWTWVSGSTANGVSGVYGTKGVASVNNFPGARQEAATWIDSGGNLWLMGGYGIDASGHSGHLNDLWRFNPANSTWAWMGGSNAADVPGTYGTKGVASSSTTPGGRTNARAWTDPAGNFWLFGGSGIDSSAGVGLMSDLWKYTPGQGTWTWVTGTAQSSAAGIYGIKGQGLASNSPGGRGSASAWTDSSGALWLFGGLGFDSTQTYGMLNDLWKFSTVAGTWTWYGGSNLRNAPTSYGVKGVSGSANTPGGRKDATPWIDSTGALWLFGGEICDCSDPYRHTNELWKFVP